MEFLKSQTALNLARSFAGESQARNRYTVYAEQARKEKQEYLARIFDQTADNEKIHAKEFLEMLQKLAGGVLLGFLGLMIAVPLAAVIGVLLRHAIENYKKSTLYLDS